MSHGHFMTATLERKVKSVSTKMVSLISNLGAATLASLQRGETQVCRWCFGLLVSQDMLFAAQSSGRKLTPWMQTVPGSRWQCQSLLFQRCPFLLALQHSNFSSEKPESNLAYFFAQAATSGLQLPLDLLDLSAEKTRCVKRFL